MQELKPQGRPAVSIVEKAIKQAMVKFASLELKDHDADLKAIASALEPIEERLQNRQNAIIGTVSTKNKVTRLREKLAELEATLNQ